MFRHLKKGAFFGYAETEISKGQSAFLASPEKALLDLLYLTPGSDSPEYLEELRFEPPEHFDWEAFRRHADRLKSRKLKRAEEFLCRMTSGKSGREL
jgi:hypothetical protein